MERGLGFVAAFLTAALAVPFWERRLKSESWQDQPRTDRHHKRPTSKVGGPAWLVGSVVGASLVLGERPIGELLRLFVPLFLAALLGRFDDLGRVRPGPKLVGQVLLVFGGFFALTSGAMATRSGPEWILACLLLLVLQLALHISDHLDGLLATTTVIGLLALVVLPGTGALPGALAAVGAGAGAGFLFWNRPRARTFLGNMGSSAVAWWTTLVLALAWLGPEASADLRWVWILPLVWPLVDFVFVCTRRIRRGVSPWTGGRDHLAHIISRRFGDRIAWACVSVVALVGLGVAWRFG